MLPQHAKQRRCVLSTPQARGVWRGRCLSASWTHAHVLPVRVISCDCLGSFSWVGWAGSCPAGTPFNQLCPLCCQAEARCPASGPAPLSSAGRTPAHDLEARLSCLSSHSPAPGTVRTLKTVVEMEIAGQFLKLTHRTLSWAGVCKQVRGAGWGAGVLRASRWPLPCL